MADTPNSKTPKSGTEATKRFCGKKGRSGAPTENRNAMRHGLRAGQLPKDAKYIENRLNAFRRQLEDAVMADKGAVSLVDAAAIQTCIRWERHAALAQRWLTKAGDTLKPAERLHFSREIARASSERDKALTPLALEKGDFAGTIEKLYGSNGDEE
jgi:hypothetical protein